MTRRIVIAIVATTIAALVLAGGLTLAIVGGTARRETEADLLRQAKEIATAVDRRTTPADAVFTRVLRQALKLDDLAFVGINAQGRTAEPLPGSLTLADLQVGRLLEGEAISGHKGPLAFAAAPAGRVNANTGIVVVTRRTDLGLGRAWRWFVLSSLVTIAIGGIVAATLGRRLARPVREARAATHRIAQGELSTRLDEPKPKADDELADLTRSINAMAAALERSQGLEQQFLLSVSHDLRTPLTSIRGYAEAIADGAGDPKKAAAIILSESRRLERLVRDLLDLAKLEQRQFSLTPSATDLGEIVTATAEGFEPDAYGAEIRLLLDVSGAAPVWADVDRLAQVIANLVENAIKHARSTVTLRTRADQQWAVLMVDDDGPGIAPEDLAHVFERLYVSRHAPVRKEAGSGLGLAIVRELVGAMGGQVQAQANPLGSGARMVVWLPAGSVGADAHPHAARVEQSR